MPEDLDADELDPTAAPSFDTDQVEVVEAFDGEDETEAGWQPSQGFVDGAGIVRVWTDGSGALERVQLSRYWRDQTRQANLDRSFAEVFLQISILFGADLLELPQAEVTESDEVLSPELLAEVNAALVELDERLGELEATDEGVGRWQGEAVTGVAEEGRVRLTLSLFGAAESVVFEPRWLSEASGSQVCQAVLVAYRDARTKFTQPVFHPGERDLIARDYLSLVERLERASGRGIAGIRQIDPTDFPEIAAPPSKETSA